MEVIKSFLGTSKLVAEERNRMLKPGLNKVSSLVLLLHGY
jgi:hypothetical protein